MCQMLFTELYVLFHLTQQLSEGSCELCLWDEEKEKTHEKKTLITLLTNLTLDLNLCGLTLKCAHHHYTRFLISVDK